MKQVLFSFLAFLPLITAAQHLSGSESAHCQSMADQVMITRDIYGVPHISARTDAQAVFGLIYAQCEDDFARIELNYIEKLGRLSEILGEKYVYEDLLIRLLIDTTEAKYDYQNAAPWLKKLLNAHADGINYYLHTHPAVKPRLINRFEPWYPLLWTDGSIGAITTSDMGAGDLYRFYEKGDMSFLPVEKSADLVRQTGSNGFAFAPSQTASGNSILYINPHTTFYFRPEVHMTSRQGLNVYGAVTWGQFFIYQGFNEHCGWMHTSSSADVSDLYAENIRKQDSIYYYEYEGNWKPVTEKPVQINYLKNGKLIAKTIKTYSTHHGPVFGAKNGKWLSLRSHNRDMNSLIQSWIRTKSKGIKDYSKAMALGANTSNNTVFADDKGNIAYWHGNYMPIRDTQYDWGKPVDGTIAGTEWKGVHRPAELIQVSNPPNGWLQNCNSTPFTAAGENSPESSDFPPYMAPDGENFRGVNAVRILEKRKNLTLEQVIEIGYDNYLSAFEILIPALIRNFEQTVKPGDALYQSLNEPFQVLKSWDYRCSKSSVATTLAIEWAQRLDNNLQRVYINQGEADQVDYTIQFAASATPDKLIPPLAATIKELENKFGTWKIAWGDINRYQRLSGEISEQFDDQLPSLPIGYASSVWGCLPAYQSEYTPNTKKRYGNRGNSFVCAVEFGQKVKAKSLLVGGNCGDPQSPHFDDQAENYSNGTFKEVFFYKADIQRHTERTYKPGQDQ